MSLRPVLLGIAISGIAFWTSAPAPGQTQHHRLMLVVSKGLPGITIYDADTEQAICKSEMGVSPHEAAFSLDGKFAYVPVYGSSSVGLPGTDEHLIHFLSTTDCKDVGTLDTGENKRPHSTIVGKSGTVYVTSEIVKSILVIDPKKREIIGKIPTNSDTSHMIAITPDEKRIFVANVQSRSVSVLDVPNRKLLKVIPTGSDTQRMALSPDGKWFVTNLVTDHKVAFYRIADQELDFTVPVDAAPFVSKFSADGKFIYTSGHLDGKIHAFKIDVAQKKVVAASTEDLGKNTGSLEVNPFNHKVYLSDQPSNTINEIDPETWKVSKRLPAEKGPDCITFATVK